MNATQRQQFLNLFEEFKKIDLNGIFLRKYQDTATIDSAIVGDYTISSLFSLCRELNTKYEMRLNADNWQVIPIIQLLDEYGQRNILADYQQMIQLLRSGDFRHVINFVKFLVHCAIKNGFWYDVEKISLGIRRSSLIQLERRATLILDHVKTSEQRMIDTFSQLQGKITEVETLIGAKKQEFERMRKMGEEANLTLSKIQNVKKNVDNVEQDCENNKSKINSILSEISVKQEELTNTQDDIKKQYEHLNEELTAFKTDSTSIIEQIREDYTTVESNKEEVKKMMGYIADGTLSHSFNQRKQTIRKRATTWMWISLGLLVLMIGWILVVFKYLSADTGAVWADLIINGIKSSPLVFAFGYALTEYTKERNLVEEYAFREAVAVTLTAYMEQLSGLEQEEQKNLLLDTVDKLYSKPFISTKEYKLFNFDTKDMATTAEALTESIKIIKSKQ